MSKHLRRSFGDHTKSTPSLSVHLSINLRGKRTQGRKNASDTRYQFLTLLYKNMKNRPRPPTIVMIAFIHKVTT